MARTENSKLRVVPHIGAPMCLRLAHNTRVCAMRVDTAAELQHKVGGSRLAAAAAVLSCSCWVVVRRLLARGSAAPLPPTVGHSGGPLSFCLLVYLGYLRALLPP